MSPPVPVAVGVSHLRITPLDRASPWNRRGAVGASVESVEVVVVAVAGLVGAQFDDPAVLSALTWAWCWVLGVRPSICLLVPEMSDIVVQKPEVPSRYLTL